MSLGRDTGVPSVADAQTGLETVCLTIDLLVSPINYKLLEGRDHVGLFL